MVRSYLLAQTERRLAPTQMVGGAAASIDLAAHVKYFLKCLDELPTPYTSLDTNRLTVAYFCVAGLDLLHALDRVDAAATIAWVYSQQLRRAPGDADDWKGGFRGAGYQGAPFAPAGAPPASSYDVGHIAMTYTALAILVILGDEGLPALCAERGGAWMAGSAVHDMQAVEVHAGHASHGTGRLSSR